MAARKKGTGKKYGDAAGKNVAAAMRRKKAGKLRTGQGKGRKVTSDKQAIAIGLSEARKKGAKVPPPKKTASRKKTGSRKKTASRRKTSPRN